MEQLVARRAHNPEVVGSNPAPATKIISLKFQRFQGFFIFVKFNVRYKIGPCFGPSSVIQGVLALLKMGSVGFVALVLMIMIIYLVFYNDVEAYNKIIIVVIFIYAVCFLLFNFRKSKRIENVVNKIEKRIHFNKLLTTVFLGSILTVILTAQTNQIDEKQVEISERETSPAFNLTSFVNDNEECYRLSNEKGMASYVTLDVEEQYNFLYQGESYKIGIGFFTQEIDDNFNMTNEQRELVFSVEDKGFDEEAAMDILNDYLQEKTNEEIIIYNEKVLKVNFFDYKNDSYTFLFNEYDERIRLSRTASDYYITPNNITAYFNENGNLDNIIKDAVDNILGANL